MLILTIRTDKPEAELGLFEGPTPLASYAWHAHRELAETLHQEIKKLLESSHKELAEVKGVVVFKGPGSFTGLRIGMSVANACAYSLRAPIVAEAGEEWVKKGIDRLVRGDDDQLALPEYGAPPHVTAPKH